MQPAWHHLSDPSEWVKLDVGSGFEEGINFYDDFDAVFVDHALATLWHSFGRNGKVCFCLRLNVDEQDQGYFSPFGSVFPPDARQWFDLSSTRIPLQDLVPDYWTWPLLTVRELPLFFGTSESAVSDELRDLSSRITWNALIRLRSRYSYVGYLVAAGIDGSLPPDDRALLAAAYLTKIEVERLLAHRHVERIWASKEFKTRLHKTMAAIGALPALDGRVALRHVANMLTSHLGAGWNRAACFCAVGDDMLRCLWAQGGDGTQAWLESVQCPVGEQIRDVEELIDTVRQQRDVEDPYFRAAAGDRPVEVYDVSDRSNRNVLAELWRADGDIRKLPSEYQEWELSFAPSQQDSQIDRQRLSLGGPIAASFDQRDPWVQQVVRDRPNDRIFASRNGRYFALPWFSRDELIGIWVVDMAYWANMVGQPETPSLVLSSEILTALGPAVDRRRSEQWGLRFA